MAQKDDLASSLLATHTIIKDWSDLQVTARRQKLDGSLFAFPNAVGLEVFNPIVSTTERVVAHD